MSYFFIHIILVNLIISLIIFTLKKNEHLIAINVFTNDHNHLSLWQVSQLGKAKATEEEISAPPPFYECSRIYHLGVVRYT